MEGGRARADGGRGPTGRSQDAAAMMAGRRLTAEGGGSRAFDAPLYWQASPRIAERPQVAATGSLPPEPRPARRRAEGAF